MELVVNLQTFSNPNQAIGFGRTCQPKGNCVYIFDVCVSPQLYDFSCFFGRRIRKYVQGGEEIDLTNSNPVLKLSDVKSASVRSQLA